jgi:hypothetical protein
VLATDESQRVISPVASVIPEIPKDDSPSDKEIEVAMTRSSRSILRLRLGQSGLVLLKGSMIFIL